MGPLETAILAALLALASGLIGAFIKDRLDSRAEKRKLFESLQSRAYADLLLAIVGLAQEPQMSKHRLLLTDAKARIAVYGSAGVTKQLAEFLRQNPKLDTSEAEVGFSILVGSMRIDANSGDAVADDIRTLLFGGRADDLPV